MFGLETANFTSAETVLAMERGLAVVRRLGVGAGVFGFGETNRAFNVGVFTSALGNEGAAGVLCGGGATVFGFGTMNSTFADASSALATGR